MISGWLADNLIEVFGAVAGILYVILEIRQSLWLWPIGIATSAAYIIVFFTARLYADMSLQAYYVVISILGWYWWIAGRRAETAETQGTGGGNIRIHDRAEEIMPVTRTGFKLAAVLAVILVVLYTSIYIVLFRFTDSPVPAWDSFITSLSIIATWMLARKKYEHWYLWIAVNCVSVLICFTRELYPTAVLYSVYGIMSVVGLIEWKKSLVKVSP